MNIYVFLEKTLPLDPNPIHLEPVRYFFYLGRQKLRLYYDISCINERKHGKFWNSFSTIALYFIARRNAFNTVRM